MNPNNMPQKKVGKNWDSVMWYNEKSAEDHNTEMTAPLVLRKYSNMVPRNANSSIKGARTKDSITNNIFLFVIPTAKYNVYGAQNEAYK